MKAGRGTKLKSFVPSLPAIAYCCCSRAVLTRRERQTGLPPSVSLAIVVAKFSMACTRPMVEWSSLLRAVRRHCRTKCPTGRSVMRLPLSGRQPRYLIVPTAQACYHCVGLAANRTAHNASNSHHPATPTSPSRKEREWVSWSA